ncbi:hypothetical protein CCACVL1_01876, partial [Corchorus capsularis]
SEIPLSQSPGDYMGAMVILMRLLQIVGEWVCYYAR